MGARNKIKTVHIEYLNIDNRRLGQNVSKSKEKYLGKPSKKNRIFHDIVQNSFNTYPPYLIMT